VFVLDGQSVAEVADTLGAVTDAGIDQPIAYFQPPYGPAVMERTAEAVASLAIDHR